MRISLFSQARRLKLRRGATSLENSNVYSDYRQYCGKMPTRNAETLEIAMTAER